MNRGRKAGLLRSLAIVSLLYRQPTSKMIISVSENHAEFY